MGRIFNWVNIPKEKRIEFLFFLVFAFSLPLISIYFPKVNSVLFVVLFSVIFFFTWVMAGIAIFRSLLVSSAILSIVIFLAQSYCNLPTNLHSADDALKSIFGFGMIYSVSVFMIALYKEMMGDEKKEKKSHLTIFKEINEGKISWIILCLYVLSMAIFISQIYQVMRVLINNMCIYKGIHPLP